ncbi:synaptonemal complex central element protein 2-like [Centroberyx affinis]|uniref:synaptonemal complex central element protein 2-like n=1 Tax=Centroberyx affinis TaxID=166261 RepID=UPI003A5C7545
MDFFFDSRPSTSQSAPQPGHEDPQADKDEGLGTDQESSRGQSSSESMIESQEQHSSSSIDDISRRVQDLVGKINDSRTNDQKVMGSFQEKLGEKVTEVCQQMKEHMYTVYEENSHDMQAKLQELSEVLESCSKLSDELQGASQALASLRTGLALSQTPEQ